MNPLLLNALARGRTILTPNQRAARAIAGEFAAQQTQPLWTSPTILPIESWLASTWQARILAGEADRVLLNRTQEAQLWREVITTAARPSPGEQPAAPSLRSPDALASLAARAWSLACLYQARGRLRETASSTDTRAFDLWSRTFGQRLAEARLITAAELAGELAAAPRLPETPVTLVDFDRHPPAVAALLARLPVESIDTTLRTDPATAPRRLHAAADDHAELESAAHWIADQRAANPAARIAVVVPNLAKRRALIERVFAPILAPESLPITAPAAPPVCEFSLGRPLLDLPIARAALDLLAWPLAPLPLESISSLLLSPWFAADTPAEPCPPAGQPAATTQPVELADQPSASSTNPARSQAISSAIAAFDAFELRRAKLLRPELTLDRMIELVERSHRGRHARHAGQPAQPPQPQQHVQDPRDAAGAQDSSSARQSVQDSSAQDSSTQDSLAQDSSAQDSSAQDSSAQDSAQDSCTTRPTQSSQQDARPGDADGALTSLLRSLKALERAARAAHIEPLTSGRPNPDRQTYAGWADDFRALLDAAGWARHATFDSLAFQQHGRFESALDELATLDFAGHRPSAEEALQRLRLILGGTVFAPESHDAPVQIMGPLELGGRPFDALWLLGADDLNWPPTAAANPLIAWQLARQLGMPGADAASDEASAQTLTRRIAGSAAQVVFSFGMRSEEGGRRPSPLLRTLDLTALDKAAAQPGTEPQALTTMLDHTLLPSLPAATVKGGARVLKLQAACGFRAFAEQRLWSAEPESREPGFDALERGNLAHSVMQHLWAELKHQAALKALSYEETVLALDQAVATAFDHAGAHATGNVPGETGWDEAYLRVQRRRMRDLLLPWLEIERQRPPFSVEPPEQKKLIEIGPLQLDLRIDRIDVTAHGRLIVDYKTGPAVPSEWQGKRPDEPQLPLYAVLQQKESNDLAGVAFALLRAGKDLGMKGVADDNTVFGSTGSMEGATLEEQVQNWEQVLARLATAFADGDSRVLPKQYPKTCQRCQQRLLCRLNPAALDAGGAEATLSGEAQDREGAHA